MSGNVRALAMAMTLGLCASASAGPDWPEICDAGSTPGGGAQPVPGGTKSISGTLNDCVDGGPPDLEDMYQFTITAPMLFCARTVNANTAVNCCGEQFTLIQGTTFDTQLWLFTTTGHGLLANDNDPGSPPLSLMGNVATDGSGAMVINPGTYYIAISSGPARDPISATGFIFNQALLTEVSGSDGPGGANPITGWTGPGVSGPTIIYEIRLCGTELGIPTVSEWGMIALACAVTVGGALILAKCRLSLATT